MKTPKKAQSKAAFVRSLPAAMPAAEVVAKGKAAGIGLTDSYVYTRRTKSSRGDTSGTACISH